MTEIMSAEAGFALLLHLILEGEQGFLIVPGMHSLPLFHGNRPSRFEGGIAVFIWGAVIGTLLAIVLHLTPPVDSPVQGTVEFLFADPLIEGPAGAFVCVRSTIDRPAGGVFKERVLSAHVNNNHNEIMSIRTKE